MCLWHGEQERPFVCLLLCAEAQIQQQEVAQAFQVLMNANAQNPGSLANLNLMNSLVRRTARAM